MNPLITIPNAVLFVHKYQNCVISVIVFLTIGLVINGFFQELPDPYRSKVTPHERYILNYVDRGITIRERLIICKTIPSM